MQIKNTNVASMLRNDGIDPAQRNSSSDKSTEASPKKVETAFVSKAYVSGERVNHNSLLGRLRTKLGASNQLAVPRDKQSGAVYATGVSKSRLEELKSNPTVERRSNVSVADRILKAANIKIPNMLPEDRIRLAVLLVNKPSLGLQVVHLAHQNSRDIGFLLDQVDLGELAEAPSVEHHEAHRKNLVKMPVAQGGLGIEPGNLIKENRPLGTGNFGKVYVFEDPQTHTKFAGKIANGQVQMRSLVDEGRMLAVLPNHPNLVQSYGVHTIGNDEVLLQELVNGGKLTPILDKLQNLSPSEKLMVIKYLAYEIFSGLRELQKLGMAHEDVRADNLLIDLDTLHVKIADFGLARERGEELGIELPHKWNPPEVLTGSQNRASLSQDAFSVSRVLLGELLPLTLLFNQSVVPNKLSGVVKEAFTEAALLSLDNAKGTLPAELVRDLNAIDPSHQLADFVEKISHPDPAQRPRPHEALKHPLLSEIPNRQELRDLFTRQGILPKPQPLVDSSAHSAVPHVNATSVSTGKNPYSATDGPVESASVQNPYSFTDGPVESASVQNPYSATDGPIESASVENPYSATDGPILTAQQGTKKHYGVTE